MALTVAGEGKQEALKGAILAIEKQFGKGSIMKMGKGGATQNIKVIPTGALSLDFALGIGGIPRGRITEIFGPEASGKSTLAMHIVKEAQALGGNAAYIDAEHAMDLNYAIRMGVDVENLLLSQPDYGEMGLTTAEILVSSGAVDVIVIDSVSALTPKAEIEGDMGQAHMALLARLMSQALRKLTAIVSKTNTSLIFINQLRDKVGVMFGNPETTTGGNALKFYSSVRLDTRRQEAIKTGAAVMGARTKIKIVKNKLAPPYRETFVNIIFGVGIDKERDIFDLSVALGIIKKSGGWYTYEEDRFQGSDKFQVLLKTDTVLLEILKQKVITLLHENKNSFLNPFKDLQLSKKSDEEIINPEEIINEED